MGFKQMLGLLMVSLGVVCLMMGFHKTGLISKKEFSPQIGGVVVLEKKASGILVSGIALLFVGGVIAVRYREILK